MTRTMLNLALGTSLVLFAIPSDVFAGRGGGRGGGGFGGGGGGGRGGSSGESRGGGMGGTPSFSQPRQPTNQSRPQGNTGYGDRSSSGNRSPYGNPSESGARPQSGASASASNRYQSQSPSNAGAAAGAGAANRNQQPNYSNAGAAAAGAGYANNNQYHPGVVNGYWNGNNSSAWGATGAGLGAATGVGAWGAGSPMYSYGYSGYNNPYAGTPQQAGDAPQQAAAPAYDYSQPISTTAAPPTQPIADQTTSAFDQARETFKAGDYAGALQLAEQALKAMPNDRTTHEFLGLVLFAQGQYDQAAAPLYAVLSVGPGWDWTTLSGMYPDVATYTGQLRNLESYIDKNPKSANARFVLAYQYLCEGHDDNAVAQLKQVVKLQPGDTLSAQLVARLQPAGGTPPTPSRSAPAGSPAVEGKLSGKWTAKDANIALAIQDDGRFTWATSGPGRPPTTIAGTSSFADGTLTLADQKGQNGALTGNVVWQDADHFNFRLAGAPSTDPGLNFAR